MSTDRGSDSVDKCPGGTDEQREREGGRVIIAGSRTLDDVALVRRAVEASGFTVTSVISGGARGVDACGKAWAADNGIPVEQMHAEWNRYGRAAGPIRNRQMAEQADALIAVWDGESRGTRHMIEEARRRGLAVHVYRVPPESDGENDG